MPIWPLLSSIALIGFEARIKETLKISIEASKKRKHAEAEFNREVSNQEY